MIVFASTDGVERGKYVICMLKPKSFNCTVVCTFSRACLAIWMIISHWLHTATGDGDNILRFCPCFHVVQLMKKVCKCDVWFFVALKTLHALSLKWGFPCKHNMSPKNACRTVIADIWKRVGQNEMFKMALISMNVNVSSSHIITLENILIKILFIQRVILAWPVLLKNRQTITEKTLCLDLRTAFGTVSSKDRLKWFVNHLLSLMMSTNEFLFVIRTNATFLVVW